MHEWKHAILIALDEAFAEVVMKAAREELTSAEVPVRIDDPLVIAGITYYFTLRVEGAKPPPL